MNIKDEELKKLETLLADYVEKNAAISITKGNANNCTCGGSCTFTCAIQCEGDYGVCGRSWKGK